MPSMKVPRIEKSCPMTLSIGKYLPDLRRRYEAAKDRAHAIDPVNADIYNREKEAVIRLIHEQQRAKPQQ